MKGEKLKMEKNQLCHPKEAGTKVS